MMLHKDLLVSWALARSLGLSLVLLELINQCEDEVPIPLIQIKEIDGEFKPQSPTAF